MSFSWNKWRQYVIEEASVNEIDEVGELTPFFQDAADMGIIRKVDAQRVMDAAGNSEDQDAFESTQEFQQIGKDIIMAAVDALEKSGRETHYLHQAFAQGSGKPIEGADISNAVNILRKGGAMSAVGVALPEVDINPEADEISPEDLDAAADKLGSMEEGIEDLSSNASPDQILKHFIEDFDIASHSTDDIPYAQEQVVKIYKEKFPLMDEFIDLWLEQNNRKTRRDVFQNVADDPEVRGMDMMAEMVATFNVGDTAKLIVDPTLGVKQPGEELKVIRVEPQIGGEFFKVQVQNSKGEKAEYDNEQLALVKMGRKSIEKEKEDGGMIGEIGVEGLVQTDEAFDMAMNEAAIERAMRVASELDTLQNDLEAELSDDELDNISDVIALLRQKGGLNKTSEK